MNRIILVMLILIAMPVYARMYQWTDPDTGTTQLSGKPPSWYRSDVQGPRVIVFEKGRIVDDTQIAISDNEREALRQQALIKVEEDMARAREQAAQAEQFKAAIQQQQEQASMPDINTGLEEEITDDMPDETVIPEEPVSPPVKDDAKAEEMRALIDLWEQQKTEQARKKVEETGFTAPAETLPGENVQ